MSEAIRKQYCVGGVWKDSKTEKWMPVTDSSTGEVIAEVPSCTQDEVLEAIDAADKAFKEWSQVSVSRRTQMMFKWRNILVEHLDELTYLCAKEPERGARRRAQGHRADGACLRYAVCFAGLGLTAGHDRI